MIIALTLITDFFGCIAAGCLLRLDGMALFVIFELLSLTWRVTWGKNNTNLIKLMMRGG